MRPASWPGAKNVGGVFGAAGDLLRPVDHRHVAADIVRGDGLVHGAILIPVVPADSRPDAEGAGTHAPRPLDSARRMGPRFRGDDSGRCVARRPHGATPCCVERGGVFHRLDDFHVAGAAADVAAERLQDFVVARVGIFPQQPGRGHDEARRAVAALRAELLVEAALHRRQLPVAPERLDGVDALARDRRRQRQAGQRRLVVDQHRAGAAFAAVAAGLGAGQAQLLAQEIEQQHVVRHRLAAVAAVERERKQPAQAFLPSRREFESRIALIAKLGHTSGVHALQAHSREWLAPLPAAQRKLAKAGNDFRRYRDGGDLFGIVLAARRPDPRLAALDRERAADADRVLDLEAGTAEFRHARGDLDRVAELGGLEEIGARIDQRDADDAEGPGEILRLDAERGLEQQPGLSGRRIRRSGC